MLEGVGVSIRVVLVLHEMRGFGAREKGEEEREAGRYKEDDFFVRHILGIVYPIAKPFLSL